MTQPTAQPLPADVVIGTSPAGTTWTAYADRHTRNDVEIMASRLQEMGGELTAEARAALQGLEAAPVYSLRIAANGQPHIHVDTAALCRLATRHATITESVVMGRTCVSGRPHLHVRNDGVRHVSGVTDAGGFVSAAKAAGMTTRRCRRHIKVAPPARMLLARDAIAADWRLWAAEGVPHREMQRRAINHPCFAPFRG